MHENTPLTGDQRAAVAALVDAVAATDGVRPLNDEATLDLGRPGARHWLAGSAAGAEGYAQLNPTFGTAQLCVHPDARGRGLGARLLHAVLDAGASGVWAFGDLPAARRLAASAGLVATRGLLIMERPLDTPVAASAPPPGLVLHGFTDADADAVVAINAAAFAHHPEQGAMTRADLDARRSAPWWDAPGLIVAEDAAGPVGFHWTKRHDAATGEVYVIGVHPRAHGKGVGTVLLGAGLAHLAASGCTRAILYVEADNPAVALYERTGFRTVHSDILYGRPAR